MAATLAVVVPVAAGAQAADTALYVVSNNTTLSVVMNRANGALSTVATLSFATTALARDPATKRIYYLSSTTAAPVGRVAYYDPVTGTNTILNGTGSGGDNVVRMAFGGGLLYAIGDSTHGSQLYTIDPASGSYTALGSVRVGSAAGQIFPDGGDIAFHPTTGVLYANAMRPASAGSTALYSINTATHIATQIGIASPTITQSALSFVNGALYSGGSGVFATINTATGVGTLIGITGASYEDFTTGPPVANLQIVVTASPTFTAGANGTYTLTASNTGPYPATGTIAVIDTLPAGLTYSSAAGTGWACSASGQIVTCTRAGPVANGTTLPAISLVAAISSGAATSVTNIARVSSSTMDDQNYANNRTTTTSPVNVRHVATTPDAATVSRLPSNATQYSDLFVVTNTGSLSDSYALAATVAPAGIVTIVSVNAVAGATGSTGTLAPGTSSNVTVVYTVASAAATGASATLTLKATSNALGTVNDAGDLTVTVIRAGIAMTKQLYRDDQTTLVTGGAGVTPGEYLQYKVSVTSSGGADATAVSVTDAIASAVTYESATADAAGWTITSTPTSVTASLSGTLATATSRYFWVRVRVN